MTATDQQSGSTAEPVASRGFASDNCSGVHPEVMAALAAVNVGHQPSYGWDDSTEQLQETFRAHFGDTAQAFPVFNGTGANVVALQAITQRWGSVICSSTAHVFYDECGAPEKVGGLKLLGVTAWHGKLTPELIDREAYGFDDEHRARPQAVSITQSTELGTAYTVDEIAAIADHAHSLGMHVHMDGARISNAAASLGVPLRAFTTDVGVDVISFGGTKNGLMFGECVVVLNPDAASGMLYVRKSNMQLGSKLRFVSAQFEALLGGDLYLRNARHANAMATRLAVALREVPGVQLLHPVEANAVFALLPGDVAEQLRRTFTFSTWNERTGEVRLMTSFDTAESDVDALAAEVRRLAG
jgi:threonine aldolase